MNQSIFKSLFTGIGLLRESKMGLIGAIICLFWVLIAIFAEQLAPFDPVSNLMPMQKPLAVYPAGGTFWLGTDLLGRDILSRIIFGTRTVLIYAPLATFCAYVVGIIMGLAGGYYQGRVDTLLSFLANIILSFPVLVLYILIIASIGASGLNIILAVTFASAPGIFRIVRGLTMDLRNREYVAAAQTRGESGLWIMFVEILPNARGPLIVDACLRMGYVIITIGVLGFLGMGLPPPTPDWGGMISEARKLFPVFPHMAIFPCIAISTLVLGLNMLSDGLREISLRD
ncbi:MAG: peptide/nickel transport system permease protein [Motiliproteus sp.]|jgi:peptide/nickel transport system permease protein